MLLSHSFYTDMTYWPTYMNSLVLCVHDKCMQLVKKQNYVVISLSFITLQNVFIFTIIFIMYMEKYRCRHISCVSTLEVFLHILYINLQYNKNCFDRVGPDVTSLDHFLDYYLFFFSLESISDILSFKMSVLIRHPQIFTRQGLFYNTVENCLKFDVEKGVCTQFIILSENFIRIIIISYIYI